MSMAGKRTDGCELTHRVYTALGGCKQMQEMLGQVGVLRNGPNANLFDVSNRMPIRKLESLLQCTSLWLLGLILHWARVHVGQKHISQPTSQGLGVRHISMIKICI